MKTSSKLPTANPILIIGQGLAGTALSARLWAEKIPFNIINQSNPKTASRVAAGVWNPVVLKRFVPTWMATEALDQVKAFYPFWEKQLGVKFFHHRALNKLLSNADERKQCEVYFEKHELGEFCNTDLDLPIPTGVQTMNGSLKVEEAGYLDVPLFLDTLQGFFKEEACYEEDEFDYEALVPAEGNWEYRGNVYSKVIFAEGAGAVGNPFLNELRFRNTKGEILKVRLDKLESEEAWNKQIFVMPLGCQEYRVGATYSWRNLDVKPSIEGRNELLEKLRVIVAQEDVEVLEHVAGIRPTMPDRRPVLGELPKHPGAFVFNGLGSRGVMLAPLMSGFLMEELMGNEAIPSEARLQRFKAFKNLKK